MTASEQASTVSEEATKPAEMLSYKDAKRLASADDPNVRRELAARDDVQPEILYYLAEDSAPEVRREIAANSATPRQADALLANDDDDEVRVSIARKISRLAPQLDPNQRDWLGQLTAQVLEQLARDQLPRVREIIAQEVRHLDSISRRLVKQLAKDVQIAVCGPILQFSPLLTDDDLLEIIRSDTVQGALNSIAKRENIGERPADAIVEQQDESAIADLLSNPSAQIREETLDQIIDEAPSHVAWHRPIVRRPNLSHRSVRRVAQFVTVSLLTELEALHDMDPETTREVAKRVSERLSSDGLNDEGLPEDRARKLYEESKLTDEAMIAAIERGDRTFVFHALALKTGISPESISSIVAARSAKVLVAVCWRAGLSMRTAFQLQLKIATIPNADLVSARDGLHYPYSGTEMREALRHFADPDAEQAS
jgi:uncharacterized protein (DUF2336 family)